MGIVYWTPFCTTMGILHIVLFLLQSQTPWNWSPYAFPADHASWYQYLTSLTLHGSWSHLTNNAFCLFAFGTTLEKRVGTFHTAVIYVLSGIGGNLLFSIFQSGSMAIGASGCIFGLICSLVFTDPKALVLTPGTPLPIPIILFAPLYVVNEIWQLGDSSSMIAHTAHIGGGLAGAAVGKWIGLQNKRSTAH